MAHGVVTDIIGIHDHVIVITRDFGITHKSLTFRVCQLLSNLQCLMVYWYQNAQVQKASRCSTICIQLFC